MPKAQAQKRSRTASGRKHDAVTAAGHKKSRKAAKADKSKGEEQRIALDSQVQDLYTVHTNHKPVVSTTAPQPSMDDLLNNMEKL